MGTSVSFGIQICAAILPQVVRVSLESNVFIAIFGMQTSKAPQRITNQGHPRQNLGRVIVQRPLGLKVELVPQILRTARQPLPLLNWKDPPHKLPVKA